MVKHDIFFPIRYEKTRPFLKKINTLINNKSGNEIFNPDFQLDVQNVIYDDMILAEKGLPQELLGDQKSFDAKLSREFNFFWFYHNWFKNGKNVFHFTKELLELFDFTDVDEIPLSTIKFPFDSFYISFLDLNRIYGIDTLGNEIYIDGVLVVKNFYKQNQIDLFVCSYVKDAKKSNDWILNKYASLYGDWFRINYQNDEDTLRKTGFIPKFIQDTKNNNLTEGTRIFFTQTVNLIFNSICYLSSDQEKPKVEWPTDTPQDILQKLKKSNSVKQSEQTKTVLRNLGFSKINFLGTDYKRTNVETGISVSTHWRRGHWRNQPFGTGLKEKKLVWIKPTIVNKDKGEPEKGHIYNVE